MLEWTVGIYMAGDEDLDGAGIRDIIEMEQVGSDDFVNILVQLDRRTPYFTSAKIWGDTRRYKIIKGVTTTANQMISLPISRLGEINTGDPESLKDFLHWLNFYDRSKYQTLILWGHGHGWKGLCDDLESNDYLTSGELLQALEECGYYYDIIGFDACLMGNFELLYEIKKYCKYVIVSEEKIPNRGWPYHYFLSNLKSCTSPEEVVRCIVSAYRDFYQKEGSGATLSGFKTDGLSRLAEIFDLLASIVLEMPEKDFVKIKWLISGVSRCTDRDYVDLLDLVRKLKTIFNHKLGRLPDILEIVYWEMCVKHVNTFKVDALQGMSVYFPEGEPTIELQKYYGSLKYTQEFSSWSKVLRRLWNNNSYQEKGYTRSS